MKKIKLYENDSYLFHKENLKNHPSAMLSEQKESELEKLFFKYQLFFVMDELSSLMPCNFLTDIEKKSHLNLYSNKDAPNNKIRELLNILSKDENGRKQYCPFCEINTCNTLDHILPKNIDKGFPEYCDMPLNLIPMCGECNTKKGEEWLDENGEMKYLNLYRDKLPDFQFLFVNIKLEKSLPIPDFYLNLNFIDSILAKKIKTTFYDLKIKDKYDEYGCNLFDEVISNIRQLKQYESDSDTIKREIKKNNFQLNYWKHVLFRECMDNNHVFDLLYKQ